MGLFFSSQIKTGKLAIWYAEEEIDFFRQKLTLYPTETMETDSLHGRKLKEWYSSRFLLSNLLNTTKREMCLKDAFGKPYLVDGDKKISISHSGDFAAVAIAEVEVGIDIQIIVSKISRIAPKFVEEEAWSFIPREDNILYLHAIWGAKESMYKAYGKRKLDFRKDMKIKPFVFNARGFYFEGCVKKDNYNKKFTLYCEQIDQLILVYACEII